MQNAGQEIHPIRSDTRVNLSDFENIYRSRYRNLYLYAGDFVADREACRDILSDVFAGMWAHRDEIDLQTVDYYLRTAVRNACITYLRNRNRRNGIISEFLNLTREQESQLDSMDSRLEELEKAIALLPERTRSALEQCSLHGLSYREVADRMGISPDGVKFHIVKAYQSIRDYFQNKQNLKD